MPTFLFIRELQTSRSPASPLKEVQEIDDRDIREEKGFFYITEVKKKTLSKKISALNINGINTVPNEFEAMTTRRIVDGAETFDIIDNHEIKCTPEFFLQMASQVRATRDQLKEALAKLEEQIQKKEEFTRDLADTELEMEKFKPFVDKASLMKKKAQFREQRKPK